MTPREYIEASGVPESTWPIFNNWYDWFERNKLVGVVRNPLGGIAGVALCRMIYENEEPKHYVHHEDGDDVFVDLTVTSIDGKPTSQSKIALKRLLHILFDNVGPRRRITFNTNGRHRSYDYMTFMRKALI